MWHEKLGTSALCCLDLLSLSAQPHHAHTYVHHCIASWGVGLCAVDDFANFLPIIVTSCRFKKLPIELWTKSNIVQSTYRKREQNIYSFILSNVYPMILYALNDEVLNQSKLNERRLPRVFRDVEASLRYANNLTAFKIKSLGQKVVRQCPHVCPLRVISCPAVTTFSIFPVQDSGSLLFACFFQQTCDHCSEECCEYLSEAIA